MAKRSLPNIDSLSISDLNALIEHAQELIDSKKNEERASTMAELKALAQAKGFSIEELMGRHASGRRKRSDAGVKLKPKYVGPNGEIYTGRGPTPRWLKALEAKGQKREKFLAK